MEAVYFKNIMVAIDFDDMNELLVDYAATIADQFTARLWIVHIAAPDPDFVGFDVGPQYIRDVRADKLRDEHRFLAQLASRLHKNGLDTEALLLQGPTVQTILEEVEKLDIDLLIAGSHEHGFLYKAFNEDTAEELFKQCQIPLLTIPLDRLQDRTQ